MVHRNTVLATFIINQSKPPSRNDVFTDEMGVWKHIGSPSQYFKVKTSDSGELHELVSRTLRKCLVMCIESRRTTAVTIVCLPLCVHCVSPLCVSYFVFRWFPLPKGKADSSLGTRLCVALYAH